MSDVVKVFTPIKRVPTVIGKSQNGQKLPFGPYTLPQVGGGMAGLLLTGIGTMTLPANPAVTFLIGTAVTVLVVFAGGLVAYSRGAGGQSADGTVHAPNPALKYFGILLFVFVGWVILTAVLWITRATIVHHFGFDPFPMMPKK